MCIVSRKPVTANEKPESILHSRSLVGQNLTHYDQPKWVYETFEQNIRIVLKHQKV
jgi:hypothetical protein